MEQMFRRFLQVRDGAVKQNYPRRRMSSYTLIIEDYDNTMEGLDAWIPDYSARGFMISSNGRTSLLQPTLYQDAIVTRRDDGSTSTRFKGNGRTLLRISLICQPESNAAILAALCVQSD